MHDLNVYFTMTLNELFFFSHLFAYSYTRIGILMKKFFIGKIPLERFYKRLRSDDVSTEDLCIWIVLLRWLEFHRNKIFSNWLINKLIAVKKIRLCKKKKSNLSSQTNSYISITPKNKHMKYWQTVRFLYHQRCLSTSTRR